MKRWVVGLVALSVGLTIAAENSAMGQQQTKKKNTQPYYLVSAQQIPARGGMVATRTYSPLYRTAGLMQNKPEAIPAPRNNGGATVVALPAHNAGAVYAGHHAGGCAAPAPAPTMVTVYQAVSKTVCEYVPVTVEQEVTECHAVPVVTKENRTEEWYEQVEKKEKVKQTVHQCVWVKKTEKVGVLKQVTKKVEQSYTVYEPVTRKEKQKYTVCVPVTKIVEQSHPVTYCESVPVQKVGMTTSYVSVAPACPPAPCAPGCGHVVSAAPSVVPVCVPYCYTSYETVQKTIVHKSRTAVCEMQQQTREQEVEIVEYKPKTVKQMVDVCSWETVYENREYQVMETKPVEQEVEVIKCELVKKSKTVPVEITTYKTEMRKVKKPVTSYQWVSRVVTECVPVQVPVYTAPAPCYTAPAAITLPLSTGCGGCH